MARATSVLGGTYTPHCAAVDPARLVRGLARAVERRGVAIYEQTEARSLRPGVVETARRHGAGGHRGAGHRGLHPDPPRGGARPGAGVLADDRHRAAAPTAFWDRAGLARRETFADHRHLVIYGQRTEDGRMAFGGRGAPYHFGSAIRSDYDRDAGVHEALRHTLVDLFPDLADAAITHRWGGPLGIARDWFTSVGLDAATGMAWAGGYVGDGVSTTNLAGRTLRDLILRRDTDLTALPWVGHRSKRWEPEPLRFLGINAGLRLAASADHAEERAGRATWHATALDRVIGG